MSERMLLLMIHCVGNWRLLIFQNIALDGLCKIHFNMSDFKTRLVSEQAELEEKLNKLNDFNQSDKVNDIDPVQKDLLLVQAGAMYTYNECLKARIARL